MLIIPFAPFAPKVFIHYENWIRDSNKEPMTLSSVKADLVLVLSHLKYVHDDRERVWYLLLDFDCNYTDLIGNTRPLPRVEPTKEAFLSTLGIAAQNGGSGLVYYGGHGELCLPGFSELVRSGPNFLYKEVIEDTLGPKETSAAGKLPYVYEGSTKKEADGAVNQRRGSSSQR
ncbi:hypothetical protein FRC00_010565, partial [Tulasnella sp. 408]